ncbi:MAG: Kelch repeat-containing protein [Polyangiales bacterium]
MTAHAEPNAISVLRTHPALMGRAGIGGSLVRDGQGHKLASTSGFRSSPIDAVLPARADQPMKVSMPGRANAWIELVVEGARSVEPRIADRAIVHENALVATDVVHVADASRVEELRVLRSDAAPKTASWKITRGADIASLRVNGDRVEALDATSHVVMSTEPIVAIDAHDVARTPKIRLEGDRLILELDTEGLAYPIVLDPSWITTTANMLSGRAMPYAQKLSDGRFLFLGSAFNVDIYDPTTDGWQADVASQHSIASRNQGGSYTVLPGGKILATGGGTSTAELYDPVLLKSTATGNPIAANRSQHTATLLPSANKVVLVGGGPGAGSGTTWSTIEVYDIGTGTFSNVTPLSQTRAFHVAALLTTGPNAGKILIAGGRGIGGTYTWMSTAELLDPTTWTSTPTANAMSIQRSDATISLVTKGPNAGKYLIAAGDSGAYVGTSTSDFYDPATNTFSAGPVLTAKHYQHAATTLSDGRVLIVGGQDSSGISVAEVYDPTVGMFTALKTLNLGRGNPSAVELSGGRLLVVGDSVKSEVYWPDAVTCTSGGTCPTGNCVDGYCCDTACTGQCTACDVAGCKGICSPVSGEAPHGTRTACTPYSFCANGACATTCGSDAVCAAGSYCDLTISNCVTKKPTGSGCTAANECSSGNCADGYCCSSSCAGTCSACDVPGSLGTCTSVVGTPHGTRSCPSPYACSASGSCASGSCTVDTDCATGRYCNGSGACVLKLSNGVACTAGSNCSSNHCVDGVCCDTGCTGSCQACDVIGKLGTCSNVDSGAPHATRSCAPYAACKLGACNVGCTTAADCTTGSYCSASKCVGPKALGQPCGTGAECSSTFCADGVCCSSSCTADCGSCAVAGLEGTCSPKPAAATCGTSGCSGSKTITIGHCSGTTTACVPGASTPCPGSLICADSTTCKTSCTVDGDCTTGACDTSSGTCTLPDGGAPDTGVADTGTPDTTVADSGAPDTFVPDTFVPESGPVIDAIAEEPAPHISDHPTVDGFTRCTKATDCSTGFCVDGVCCDTACNEGCHSCALLSSPGKCALEPIGVDLRSDCGPANTCLGTCDGKGQCIGAGSGTMCGRNRCTSASTGVGPAYCPAPGAKCPLDDGVVFDCAPYLCEPAFGACRTQCVASSDCANGFVCDIGSKTCIMPPPPEDSGGCVFGAPSGSKGMAIFAGILLAATVRRRRARAS